MFTDQPRTQDRIRAAIGVAALQALLGYALITGLGVPMPTRVADTLKLFDIIPTPPPPPIEPPRPRAAHAPKPKGAAAPPNLKAKPTEIVAPQPRIPLPVPPPIAAAPVAGPGAQASAGAAAIRGPGTGAGGQGVGTGSGDSGDGDGGGGGTPLRYLKGRIKSADFGRDAFAGKDRSASVRYVVGVTGRVISCMITRSSGLAAVDQTLCRLITERFRFKPELDERGRPVPATVEEDHEWEALPASDLSAED